jgi:hypothetical protein
MQKIRTKGCLILEYISNSFHEKMCEIANSQVSCTVGESILNNDQGRHGWQGPQGLGLAWISQNRKRQRRHKADVVTTVAALPAKNWPWRP